MTEDSELSQNNDIATVISDTSDTVPQGGSSEGVFIVNENGEKIGEMTPMKDRKGKQEDGHVSENMNCVDTGVKMELI